jgi:tRNA pseudouridine synthase 9
MVESEGTKCLKLGKRLQPQSDEHMYEVRSGLRFVKPYEHEFTSFTKRRWIGQMLFDIFSTEFKAFSSNYYSDAIKSGMITVNGKKVGLDYRLKDSDRIVHKTTRQETPVLSDLPAVVFESDDLIAVNKPCSIPVHPCGNFNYNSLTNIVEICLNYKGLKSVHRLDR